MSIRARLLLASLATLAVGLAALVVVGNVLLSARVGAEQSNLLRAQAQAQIAALDVGDRGVRIRETPNDAALDRGAWILDGPRVIERPPRVSRSLDGLAVTLGRRARSAELAGPGDVRLRVQPVRDPGGSTRSLGAVVVARSDVDLERLQHQVLVGSTVIALLVLLAGAVVIRRALDGALRPVARMTDAAEDWSEHDLDQRFGLGPARDELTGLAATLDHMLGRIAASRRAEQRFASEVAHELRTPVAGLRGRAELALAATGAHVRPKQREALEAVIIQADRIDTAVDTLLAVARRELDGTAGRVDLEALAREVGDVTVEAPAGLPAAEGDPAVVRRALAPLVDNARRHARRHVTLRLSADEVTVRLTVADDGPGPQPALVEAIFDAGFSSQPDGAGLGLPLARRLARSCGGDIVLGPGPGGSFTLVLPVGPVSPS